MNFLIKIIFQVKIKIIPERTMINIPKLHLHVLFFIASSYIYLDGIKFNAVKCSEGLI